jgi:hypothetical protein
MWPSLYIYCLLTCLQISDLDSINTHTHGFSRDGIPESGFGGFVLQRITKEKAFSGNI